MHATARHPTLLRTAAAFLLGALAFGLAYCQAPLYYSNQHQYFLHGLARAGEGLLAEDWLANTADPTPLFTGLVAVTVRWLHPYAFHLYYVFLFGIYLASLAGLFSFLAGTQGTSRLRFCFVVLVLLVHSALVRWGSYWLLGFDYACYAQGWLAAQYVLGPVLQPSTFGVLLILAVGLFVRERPFAAIFSACLASTVHSTYLLGAALLTLAFLFVQWRDGHRRRVLLLGGWALALAAPVTLFTLLTFGPTSAEAFAEAQRILVHDRIPHHCLPELWCDGITVVQVLWIMLALLLARGTRLGTVLLLVFLASAALTLLQVITHNDTLALLFPWRTSVILVPLATTIILARLVIAAARWFETRAAVVAMSVVLVALVGGGVAIQYTQQGFQSNPEEVPLLEFVKASKRPGAVYLLPIPIPNLKATVRGSLSSDFKPAPAKKTDSRLIPVDLQRFRLHTGAPIFVDFKSVPYRDVDVLEWQQRLEVNRRLYEYLRAGNLAAMQPDLQRFRITHVVVTADLEVRSPDWHEVCITRSYRVYRLTATAVESGQESTKILAKEALSAEIDGNQE